VLGWLLVVLALEVVQNILLTLEVVVLARLGRKSLLLRISRILRLGLWLWNIIDLVKVLRHKCVLVQRDFRGIG